VAFSQVVNLSMHLSQEIQPRPSFEEKLSSNTEIDSGLLWMAIASFLLRHMDGNILFYVSAFFFGILLFCSKLIQSKGQLHKFFALILLFSLFVYFQGLVVNAFQQGWIFLPLLVSSLGVAWELYDKGISDKAAKWLLYFVGLVFVYKMYTHSFMVDDIFKGSRNQISVMFINLGVLYYICAYKQRVKYSFFPSIFVFLICVSVFGASGILASFILVVGVFFYRFFGETSLFKTLLVLFALFLIYILVNHLDDLSNILFAIVEDGGHDMEVRKQVDLFRLLSEDIRYKIWGHYISELDIANFLFGRPLDFNYLGVKNLHSSYFLLHLRAGIFAVPVFIALIVLLLKSYFESLMLFFCLLSLLVRAYSDTVLFGTGVFDWVFLFLAISIVSGRRKKWSGVI